MVVPNALFMTSQVNSGKYTKNDLELLGKRLSIEVKDFLNDEQEEQESNITRISFIGHSMGGIIIRAALPRLEEYKHMFFTYTSLSSPHLGYTFHKSTLITTGIWFMRNFQDCYSLS